MGVGTVKFLSPRLVREDGGVIGKNGDGSEMSSCPFCGGAGSRVLRRSDSSADWWRYHLFARHGRLLVQSVPLACARAVRISRARVPQGYCNLVQARI